MGGERQRNTNLLFHLGMLSLVESCICTDRGSTHNLDILGPCSNQLSFLARGKINLEISIRVT